MYEAENLWQQGRGLIAEMIRAVDFALKNDSGDSVTELRNLGNRLITTFDVEKLMDILLERLPALKIKGFYVALYNADGARPPEWSQLVMAYDAHEQVNLVAQGGRRFSTRHLLPPDKWPQLSKYNLIITPLYFQHDQIGLLIFEVGANRDGVVFHTLRSQLSSALKGAQILLERQRAEHAAIQRAAEREQAYRALRENQEKLLIAEKMASLGRLTAGIAHKMNTPLAATWAILMELNQLVQEYQSSIEDTLVTPADHQAIAHDMQRALDRAIKTTQQVINFVRSIKVQSRDLTPAERQGFDAVPVIQETLLLLEPTVQNSQCRVNFEPGPAAVQLYGPPERLAQVVTSLMMNAIEASLPKGGGLIIVRLIVNPSHLELQVADQGCGIAPEHLPKIFDPMFTTKPFGEAAGLGLTLAHDIVKSDFDGTIQVTSQVDQGTTFSLIFPHHTNDA